MRFIFLFLFAFARCVEKDLGVQHSTILNDIQKFQETIRNFYQRDFYLKDTQKKLNVEVSEVSKEQSQRKAQNSYDIKNRFILSNSYDFANFTDYDFFYYKSITKHDNGFFSNILLMMSRNNTIFFHDVFGHFVYNFTLDYPVSKLLSFKVSDESDFYVLNSERNKIVKYSLRMNKFNNFKNQKNFNGSNDKITIRTFQEMNGKKENMIYNLNYRYDDNMMKITFHVDEKEKLIMGEEILHLQTQVIKGIRIIHLVTSNKKYYRVRASDLQIIHNITFQNIDLSKKPLFMNNHIGFFSEKALSIFSISNNVQYMRIYEPPNKDASIVSAIYESTIGVIFILLSNGDILFTFPNFHNLEYQFGLTKFTSVSFEVDQRTEILLMRRDLIIFNSLTREIEFINFENVDFSSEDSFRKKNHEVISLEELSVSCPRIIKSNLEHYFSYLSEGEILLYVIPNINSKIKSKSDINFNFKVPIIFIALIIIFIVNFYKKKSKSNSKSDEAIRGQVMDELKRYSEFPSKKFKED